MSLEAGQLAAAEKAAEASVVLETFKQLRSQAIQQFKNDMDRCAKYGSVLTKVGTAPADLAVVQKRQQELAADLLVIWNDQEQSTRDVFTVFAAAVGFVPAS